MTVSFRSHQDGLGLAISHVIMVVEWACCSKWPRFISTVFYDRSFRTSTPDGVRDCERVMLSVQPSTMNAFTACWTMYTRGTSFTGQDM
jgi:hypothetical protein